MRGVKLLEGTDSVEMANRMKGPCGRVIKATHFCQCRIKVSNKAQNETRIGSSNIALSSYHPLPLSTPQIRNEDENPSPARGPFLFLTYLYWGPSETQD